MTLLLTVEDYRQAARRQATRRPRAADLDGAVVCVSL
jgi:hypothetical protein